MRAGIGSQPWVGLDIGSFSVKVVAVQTGVAGTRYWSAESGYPAPDEDGERRLTPDGISRAVVEVLSQVELAPRSVGGMSLGVSGPDVIVKQITMPLIDDAELSSALRFEARKHLPFDPQTMALDFQVLKRDAEEHKSDLLLAAVARDRMERHLAPLKMLGIDPEIVDATPLALANAVTRNGADPGVCVLLDIGSTASHLVIHHREQPFFARRFEFGGRTLSRAIAQSLKIPFGEAERRKVQIGRQDRLLGSDWESPEGHAVAESLQHDLVEEVVRSIAFYRTQAHFADLPRLWLSGGTARLAGIAPRLGEMLGVAVEVFDPFGPMASTKSGTAPPSGPHYTQAFGLAMRAP
jgi:type IV pilus assembly protein PilM